MIKTLIIIRGLPGSGKSTFAQLIAEEGKYPVYCIDDFFTDPASGVYKFDFKDNFKAYILCEGNTEKSMMAGVEKIIVENVFSLEWEMEPYFRLAESYLYKVHVVTLENRHGGKNIHGVDKDQVEKMRAKFRVKL